MVERNTYFDEMFFVVVSLSYQEMTVYVLFARYKKCSGSTGAGISA